MNRRRWLTVCLFLTSSLWVLHSQAQNSDKPTANKPSKIQLLKEKKTDTQKATSIKVIKSSRQINSRTGEQAAQLDTKDYNASTKPRNAEAQAALSTQAKKTKKELDKKTEKDNKQQREPGQKTTRDPDKDSPPREPKPVAETKPSKPRPTNTRKPRESREPVKPKKPFVNRNGSLLGQSLPPLPSLPPSNPTQASTKQNSKADFEPHQLMLVSKDMALAKAAARKLRRYQLTLKSRQKLDQLNLVVSIFRLPTSVDTLKRLARIRSELPHLMTDTNQRYRLLSRSRKDYAKQMLNWPPGNKLNCLPKQDLHIGIIDTPVNPKHPALTRVKLTNQNFSGKKPADAQHGTAIASLIAGNAADFKGLLTQVRLFAANVFRKRDKYTETNTESLLPALNWLVGEKVSIINLSFGGKQNTIFEHALNQVIAKNITLVAAAGNQGAKAPPIYPAAQKGVIAVTAVDAARRLYPQANQGDYIDFSAPGVDIWSADGQSGGRYHSGTSFAAPHVTAALALIKASNTRKSDSELLIDLKEKAHDLGPSGKDNQFGWGLISGPDICRP